MWRKISRKQVVKENRIAVVVLPPGKSATKFCGKIQKLRRNFLFGGWKKVSFRWICVHCLLSAPADEKCGRINAILIQPCNWIESLFKSGKNAFRHQSRKSWERVVVASSRPSILNKLFSVRQKLLPSMHFCQPFALPKIPIGPRKKY